MTLRIETERLILRRPRLDDLDRVVTLLGDIEIARNLAFAPHPYQKADALKWFPSKCGNPPPDNTTFLIETDRTVVGSVGFHPEGDEAEIGYWLARPFWGRGLMTEAVRAVVAWYFEATGARAILSAYFTDNPASWRVQEKLGFAPSGKNAVLTPLARTEPAQSIGTIVFSDTFMPVGSPS